MSMSAHSAKRRPLRRLAAFLFCLLIAGLCLGLGACSQEDAARPEDSSPASSPVENTSSVSSSESIEPSSEEESSKEESSGETSAESASSSSKEASAESSGETSQETDLAFEVEPGSYLKSIVAKLHEMGYGSEEELLSYTEDPAFLTSEAMQSSHVFREASQREISAHRAYQAEGYIPAGTYLLPEKASPEEALGILLSGWDRLLQEAGLLFEEGELALPREAEERLSGSDLTFDDLVIMASLIEKESAFNPSFEIKEKVSAVLWNRIEDGSRLQLDVTIFYLEEGLFDPSLYESYETFYDCYEVDKLPAGPICSPSLESLLAALSPADTNDFFFVYKESTGEYFFAEDYDTHLENCDLVFNNP